MESRPSLSEHDAQSELDALAYKYESPINSQEARLRQRRLFERMGISSEAVNLAIASNLLVDAVQSRSPQSVLNKLELVKDISEVITGIKKRALGRETDLKTELTTVALVVENLLDIHHDPEEFQYTQRLTQEQESDFTQMDSNLKNALRYL